MRTIMENKKCLKATIVLWITLYTCSCVSVNNSKDRDKLVFSDSITDVIDSLNVMNEILLKSGEGNYTYGIDVDMNNTDRNENELFLYINDDSNSVYNVGNVTDTSLYQSKLIDFIDSSERKHFVNLAMYLKKNHLSGCKSENGKLIYFYREFFYLADAQIDLDRFITFSDSEKDVDPNRYKILDRYGNLLLLANKDAAVQSSN